MIRVFVVDAYGRRARAPGLARWLARVAPSRAAGTVTIALVSDVRMRALNRRFRKKNYATDVLSFLAARGAPPPRARARRRGSAALPSGASRGPRALLQARSPAVSGELGDIVIAKGVAARQAREQGHSTTDELRILALHGLLHLLGYDHETDSGQMAELERRLRREGGLNQGLTERGRRSGGV